MTPAALTDLTALTSATLRAEIGDFTVDEIPVYEASGEGEHAFVTFEKRGVTTIDAVRILADAWEIDPRAAGYAGMKDRHAITTQRASFPFAASRDLDATVAAFSHPDITVTSAIRHGHKLKPGHLVGNRFTIVLRDVPAAGRESLEARLSAISRYGVPNAYGDQRFGRRGDNAVRALEWLQGKWKGPRDRRKRKLMFSALQSKLFNDVLERRISRADWHTVLRGDVAKKHESGGIFEVGADGADLESEQARASNGEIAATGPMFGAKMRWPGGQPAEIERESLAAAGLDEELFARNKALGKGTRRSLVLRVSELAWEPLEQGVYRLCFVLPKGGYATTLLGHACQLNDVHRQPVLSSNSTGF